MPEKLDIRNVIDKARNDPQPITENYVLVADEDHADGSDTVRIFHREKDKNLVFPNTSITFRVGYDSDNDFSGLKPNADDGHILAMGVEEKNWDGTYTKYVFMYDEVDGMPEVGALAEIFVGTSTHRENFSFRPITRQDGEPWDDITSDHQIHDAIDLPRSVFQMVSGIKADSNKMMSDLDMRNPLVAYV